MLFTAFICQTSLWYCMWMENL